MKDFKNSLLKRREVAVEMESEGNPGFENAKKMIASQFKSNEENIVVKSVRGSFGSRNFIVDALVYDSKEDKEKTERKPRVKKAAAGQAAPAAQPAAAQPASAEAKK